MIYYPLATLMQGFIRDVLVITRPDDRTRFELLLGDGSDLGMNIEYAVQESPGGIAEAYLVAKGFLEGARTSTLILGDNVFFGDAVSRGIRTPADFSGARIFAHHVDNPQEYGVVHLDEGGEVLSLEEKPARPETNYAVTGLYVFDSDVVEIVEGLQRSDRGELEITAVNQAYLDTGRLEVHTLPEECAWFDAGTFHGLWDAGSYVRLSETRDGIPIGNIREVAWQNGWITDEALERAVHHGRSPAPTA